MIEVTDTGSTCPRRINDFGPWDRSPGLDGWRVNHMRPGAHACTFCGSLHPDEFMELIEAGERWGWTDKRYKAYVGNYVKFYYVHLSAEQRQRCVDLLRAGDLNCDGDGALPFFIKLVGDE